MCSELKSTKTNLFKAPLCADEIPDVLLLLREENESAKISKEHVLKLVQ
jgi:hypothetical protein